MLASAPTEHVKIATMWIAPERLLHLKRQAIHTAAHVCDARREPHPHTRRWNNHPRSTDITRRSAARLTSLPTKGFDAKDVLAVYRLRWQIELAFKRLKSLLHIDRLPARSERGARSWIYAHLILAFRWLRVLVLS